MSLLEEAEIWASGSRPDCRPCRSEHGASGVESGERAEMTLTFTLGRIDGDSSDDDLTYAHAVTHIPTWELLSLTTALHYLPLKY